MKPPINVVALTMASSSGCVVKPSLFKEFRQTQTANLKIFNEASFRAHHCLQLVSPQMHLCLLLSQTSGLHHPCGCIACKLLQWCINGISPVSPLQGLRKSLSTWLFPQLMNLSSQMSIKEENPRLRTLEISSCWQALT